MPRWKRNLIVWSLCAMIIVAAVLLFIYYKVPPESQQILDNMRRR